MTTDTAVRILAVIGGGLGGGIGSGWLAGLLMRAFAVRNPPRWSLMTVRMLSGLICGWLVALWLFGGGGAGIGGSGGLGLGGGTGSGDANEKVSSTTDKSAHGEGTVSDEQTLRIEVLGVEALKSANRDAAHCYRLDKREGTVFLTWDEVKDEITHRRDQGSLHRIEIVLYKDSPNDDRAVVSRLKNWSRDRKLQVDIVKSTADAPR
jgi:hypothetical protein